MIAFSELCRLLSFSRPKRDDAPNFSRSRLMIESASSYGMPIAQPALVRRVAADQMVAQHPR
jgi:hypothetical protein